MGAADENPKRRRPHEATADARPPKRRKSPDAPRPDAPKPAGPAPKTLALSTFHEATLAELRPKYDVLVASVISSTKIAARVQRVLGHLRTKPAPDGAAPLVLLHARPADVCKMITVAEKAKVALAGEGGAAYQYNHLFELPPRPVEPGVVEETVLAGAEGAGEEESDDGFEKFEIFDRAANPRKEARPVRSMGIFLAGDPVPELKGKGGVTVQTAGRPPDES